VTVEFRLPDVGEGIASAEILEWLVAEGDTVREHQDIVQIQTDKAVVEIPSPATGVVSRLCVSVGDTVDVGALLVVIDGPTPDPSAAPDVAPADERPYAAPATQPGPLAAPATERPLAAPATPPRPLAAPAAERPLASPSTRHLAHELGVDLAELQGSGPDGRILRADVERAAEEAGEGEVVPLRGTRRVIAHTLTRAWREVPRIIDYREVDATALLELRARLALTPAPLIVRAAVIAAREHPYVNASIDLERETITLHRRYHVGIATAGPDGLTVPVLHDADRRSLTELADEIATLSQAARERRLTPEQLAGATLTVNNFGSLGTWMGTPIVRPPEVVNLGVGAIRDRVVAVDGAPVVRPTLVISAAADHRVLDGDTLAAYVTRVAALLESPEDLS
jgi:pyruvate/2-oxoglutarate dehydrogenase complex dihydrolipoamide acyltransferase (E2) component